MSNLALRLPLDAASKFLSCHDPYVSLVSASGTLLGAANSAPLDKFMLSKPLQPRTSDRLLPNLIGDDSDDEGDDNLVMVVCLGQGLIRRKYESGRQPKDGYQV